MLAMLTALLMTLSAQAQIVSKSVKVCVDYDVEFTDANSAPFTPSNPQNGIGDHWDNNEIDRVAIGMEFQILSSVDLTGGNLGTNGCATKTIDIELSDPEVDLRVFSRTERRGVDIEMREDSAPDPDGKHHWEDGADITHTWTNLPVSTRTSLTEHHVVLDAVDGWQVLAVATWMIHRNKWGLGANLTRECCLSGGAADGTCTGGDGYERDRDPYFANDPKLRILVYGTDSCCGSRIESRVDVDGYFSCFAGNKGATTADERFALAHELGHVPVGLRMGGREQGQYQPDAPVDDCMGTYRDDLSPQEVDCASTNPPYVARRGPFTKEFMAMAAREGWADFVSAWTWNVKSHSDCEIYLGSYADFDLDGDVDNLFGDWRDQSVSCRNHPELAQADSSDPTDPFVGTQNWLGDVLDEGVCDPFDSTPQTCEGGSGCASDTTMESYNRSTLYDWQRMLYALYKDQGLTPKELSDLYINMCPRNWRVRDGTCTDTPTSLGDDLPLRRWVLSATALGHSGEVAAEILGVQH